MTRASQMALKCFLIMLAPIDAWAQFGRGGMVGNRGNFNNFGRPNAGINPNNFVRQNGNNIGNRQTNTNVINNVTNVINQNNVNSNNINNRPGYARPGLGNGFGGGFGGISNYGGGGYRGWGGPAVAVGGFGGGYQANSYYASHSNWVNGSWGGNYRPGWGNYPGIAGYGNAGNNALAVGSAVGVAAWGLGSLINSFGYARYSNPYLNPSSTGYLQQSLIGQQSMPFDYARPLNLAAAPTQAVVQSSVAMIDLARDAFMAGDSVRALALADKALLQTPNDPMLHEFRAICLFSIRRYDEAAVPLYTVLSAGPGWDWTTLMGLYPGIETYTSQLRALEAYCNASPRAASARFVLAALYLTQGNSVAASARFREVIALQPQDRLSAQLLAAITSDPAAAPTVARAEPATVAPTNSTQQGPSLPSGPVPTPLLGPWNAVPAEGVTISLILDRDGKTFTWKVIEKGTAREFHGEATSDADVLALLTNEMPPMVARVTWNGASQFNFRVIGASQEDPGLVFSR